MRRRDLFVLLGSTAIAWPLATSAQTRVAQVGILPFLDWRKLDIWPVFVNELRNCGWIEGKNLQFYVRPVDGTLSVTLNLQPSLLHYNRMSL